MVTRPKPSAAIDLTQSYKQVIDSLGRLMRVIGGGVALLDRDHHIAHYSESYEEWFGPLSRNRGKLCYEVFCNRRDPCPQCPSKKVFGEPLEELYQNQVQVVTCNGEKRIIRSVFFPVTSIEGSISYVMEVGEDLTEKRRTIVDLNERTRQLTVLFKIVDTLSGSPDLRHALRQTALILLEEMHVSAICTYLRNDASGEYELELCKGIPHARYAGMRSTELGASLASLVCPSGRCCLIYPEDYLISPWPIDAARTALAMPLQSDGENLGLMLIFSTAAIGEQEQTENFCQTLAQSIGASAGAHANLVRLHRLQKRYRDLFEASADAITVVDPDLKIIDANSAAQRTGFSREEILGHNAREFLAPEGREVVDEIVRRVLSGERLIFEMDEVCKDGSRLPEEHSAARFEFDGRDAAIVVSRDITDRRRAEEQSRRLVKLAESISDAVAIVDADLTVSGWNPGAERLLGYAVDEVVGRKVPDFHPDTAAIRKILHEVEAGGEFSGEYQFRKRSGEPVTVLLRVSRLDDVHGNLEGYVGIATDITELKQTQQQLFQAQKMESIGTLAGGIAHDFNNVLSGILGHASFLKATMPEDSENRVDVERIEKAARRAAKLTRQLLGFARRGPFQPQPIDLNDVVGETLDVLSRTMYRISIRRNLHHKLHTVNADRTQMEQVLMNLCINSRDAMPKGGTMLVETENIELGPGDLKPEHPAAAPGLYVRMSVSDTGGGMDEETRRRAFDPFFTRKKGGTGLGLSTVYGIVTSHQGFVMLYSEPGKGTTVRIYIPADGEEPGRRGEPAAEIQRGHELILVVDDDIGTQQSMARMLGNMGYRAIITVNGSEALAVFAEHKDEIELVILDMILPDVPGEEVFQRMQQEQPAVRVLLCSGFSESEDAGRMKRQGALGFLEKPFTMAELSSAVRQALDVVPAGEMSA